MLLAPATIWCEDRGERGRADVRRVGAVPVEGHEAVPRAEVRDGDSGVRHVVPVALHLDGAGLGVVGLPAREDGWLARGVEERCLERVVEDGRDGGAECLSRPVGSVFLTVSVTRRRGVFVAFGAMVLSRGFPGEMSVKRSSQSDVGLSTSR